MGIKWGGLKLGDYVSRPGRTRRMIITDMDPGDPRQITAAWRDGPRVHERTFRIAGLVLVARAVPPAKRV